MFAVAAVVFAAVTLVVGEAPNADPATEVVPGTIDTSEGVIITNGTPDKRCWFFVPVPPPQNQNQPNGARIPFGYYYNNFRYPYLYGRRPARRPTGSNNQNTGTDLPVFGSEQSNAGDVSSGGPSFQAGTDAYAGDVSNGAPNFQAGSDAYAGDGSGYQVSTDFNSNNNNNNNYYDNNDNNYNNNYSN